MACTYWSHRIDVSCDTPCASFHPLGKQSGMGFQPMFTGWKPPLFGSLRVATLKGYNSKAQGKRVARHPGCNSNHLNPVWVPQVPRDRRITSAIAPIGRLADRLGRRASCGTPFRVPSLFATQGGALRADPGLMSVILSGWKSWHPNRAFCHYST